MRRPAAQPASSIPRFLFSLNRCGTTTREPDLSGRANSRPGILLKNPACGPGGGAAGNRKPVRTIRASVRTASGANSGSQAIGLRPPGALGHAGLMRLGRLGMPRMMHDMTLALRDVFAHMIAVAGGVLHCLGGLNRLGRWRGRRLGLDGRRGGGGSRRAGRRSGDRRAGDQARRKQRGGEFGQHCVSLLFRRFGG